MLNQMYRNKISSYKSIDFWDKIKYLSSNPNLFFEKIKSEEGIKNSLLTFIIVGFFVDIISYGMYYGMRFMQYRGSLFGTPLGFFELFAYFGFFPYLPTMGFLLVLLISFAYSGMIHAIVIAFKGEGTYVATYKAYAYGMIPFLILKLIPLIGYLSIVYSFILMIKGVAKLHNISKVKSALACLMPIIFFIGILIIAIIYFFIGWGYIF